MTTPADPAAPGTIGLVAIGGEVGRLIRFGQYLADHPMSEWFQKDTDPTIEHAFVYLGNGQLIEAEPGGARIASITEYSAVEQVYWCNNIAALATPAQLSTICADGPGLQGVPYSFVDYFALAAHRLHLWAPGLKSYVQSSKHLICSQLCDYLYQEAGVHIFTDNRWDGDVMPLDLYLRDLQLGAAKK